MLHLFRSTRTMRQDEVDEASRRHDAAYADLRDALRRLLQERNQNGRPAEENAR